MRSLLDGPFASETCGATVIGAEINAEIKQRKVPEDGVPIRGEDREEGKEKLHPKHRLQEKSDSN